MSHVQLDLQWWEGTIWELDLPLFIDCFYGFLAPSRLDVVTLRGDILFEEGATIEVTERLLVLGVRSNINKTFIEPH